jgi:4-carboxymuconolactone decarboxylase
MMGGMSSIGNPRIQPLPRSEWTDTTRAVLGPLAAREPLENVFTTLVRHPDLWRRYSVFGAHILNKSTLAHRDRELAILRTGFRRRCEYEFAQHTTMARSLGWPEDDIERVLDGPDAAVWTAHEAAVLRAVDDLIDRNTIADATWSQLCETLDEQQLMDLVFTIGTYSMVCWAVNAFGVVLDEHIAPHPWR